MKQSSTKLALSGLVLATLATVGQADADTASARQADTRVAAATSIELGGHINPVLFEGTGQPVIGGLWTSEVCLNDFPSAAMTFVVVSQSFGRRVGTPAGELLISPSQLVLLDAVRRDPKKARTLHSVAIPDDPALMGLEIASQAAVLLDDPGGRSLVLTNGLGLRLGIDKGELDQQNPTSP